MVQALLAPTEEERRDCAEEHPARHRLQRTLRGGSRVRCTLADAFGASIHVLHVLEDLAAHAWTTEVYVAALPGVHEEMERQARERLDAVVSLQERDRYRVRTELRTGSPFVEIVRYAQRREDRSRHHGDARAGPHRAHAARQRRRTRRAKGAVPRPDRPAAAIRVRPAVDAREHPERAEIRPSAASPALIYCPA